MKMEQESIAMEVVNPQAAGIDVGSRSHWVAVGQSEKDVCEFGVFSQDLFALADWLKQSNVKTVAMEKYWHLLAKPICRFDIKGLSGSALQWEVYQKH
jgi:transposase